MPRLHVHKRPHYIYRDCELCRAVSVPCRAFDDDMGMRLCISCERFAENAEMALIDAGCSQPDVFEAARMRHNEIG